MTERAARIASDMDALPTLIALVDRFADDIAADAGLRYRLQLVVEELSVNAIAHGYRGAADGWLFVRLRQVQDGAEVTIEDGAPAFDPASAQVDEAVATTLEVRGIGGLGLLLVRHAARTVSYQRIDQDGEGVNRTTARLSARRDR